MTPVQLLLPAAADTPPHPPEVARSLHHRLRHRQIPIREFLKRLMTDMFGADDAEGVRVLVLGKRILWLAARSAPDVVAHRCRLECALPFRIAARLRNLRSAA